MAENVQVSGAENVDPGAVPGMVTTPTPEGGVSVTNEGVPDVTPEPTGRPEKFKSDDDGWKAYRELEKKFHNPEAKPDETPPAEPHNSPDLAEFSAEYAKEGKLTDESYKKLADKGLSKELVNDYIAGKNAIADANTATLVAEAGGEQALKSMQEWAETNYTDAQLTAYNTALEGDEASLKMALGSLKANYQNAKGVDPDLLTGKAEGVADNAFRSQAEVTEAMADPRYDRDPAFRADVYERMRNVKFMMSTQR